MEHTKKHPYMKLSKWTSGKLAFWRRSAIYNQKKYEAILQRWMNEASTISSNQLNKSSA